MQKTLLRCGVAALALLVGLGAAGSGHAEAEDAGEVRFSLPPTSLAQWYKPANKRQVWLHAMFKLGTALSAVKSYAAVQDGERTEKWAGILAETYHEIPEMVPEWRGEVELQAAQRLTDAARQRDWSGVQKHLTRLGRTCRACHGTFRLPAATLYRSPDFSRIKVGGVSFRDVMKEMKRDLNALKIARADERLADARASGRKLQTSFKALGETCATCHRDAEPRERILGATISGALQGLIDGLKEPHDPKQTGRLLGTVGFAACGRCHGIHRQANALREAFAEPNR